jgi:hypothetical protein
MLTALTGKVIKLDSGESGCCVCLFVSLSAITQSHIRVALRDHKLGSFASPFVTFQIVNKGQEDNSKI